VKRGFGRCAAGYAAAGCASLLLLAFWVGCLRAQSGPSLSDAEEEKLREAQDPGERIGVYLDLMQERLDRFESFRHQPDNPKYDNAGYLGDLLQDYVAIDVELKNWIDYQYQQQGDMRDGLRKLLERGPQQLALLRGVQGAPDRNTAHYADSLRDAIDQLSDTLDGATQAIGDQVKKFGELKREEKVAARAAKERAKEEKKRSKEEKKLRKRQNKGRVPGESDED
jgi:hypothetical protein